MLILHTPKLLTSEASDTERILYFLHRAIQAKCGGSGLPAIVTDYD